MPLDHEIAQRIKAWQRDPFDEKTQKEVRALAQNDPKGAIDAFYTTLSFGTGGLRGIMGPGTNRMNIYTVRMATQGLANYLLKQFKTPSVMIGFDSRNNSKEFALQAARVLAANNIHTYLLKEMRPTPFISFACRAKECQAAINITASHNPAAYNGYKVYWADGGQIVPPHDKGIIDEVHKIADMAQVKVAKPDDPHIELVDGALDRTYLKATESLQLCKDQNRQRGASLKITYTPLHGTGITLLPQALQEWGFTNLNIVSAQSAPDGNFPTIKVPNPEFKETLMLGIQQMLKTGSDILLGTDPDADRLALAVNHKGTLHILSGNQIASLITFYLCNTLSQRGELPENGAVVTTIVSTDLIRAIAQSFGIRCFEVLTGFKYIAEKIHLWEMGQGDFTFLFGAEESFGYLMGTFARDKDAVSISCVLAEMALHAKLKGKTLIDLLYDIYKKWGVFYEKQLSLNFEPTKEGMEKMDSLMRKLREHLPKTFCSQEVVLFEDYKTGIQHDLLAGTKSPLALPSSDVLLFRLKDFSKVVVRPSGTEPKIKIYASVHEQVNESVEAAIDACCKRIDALLNAAKNDLEKLS